MALTTRTVSIVGAVVVSTGLIAGAFVLSGPLPFANLVKRADAQSTAELLKTFAAKDSDSDGLPDWQESLYGTDPKDPESVVKGTLDSDAVAQGLVQPKFVTEASALAQQGDSGQDIPGDAPSTGSVTEQFAQLFFKNYMTSRGSTPPTEAEMLQFVNDAVLNLQESRKDSQHFTINQVNVAGSGPNAIRQYMSDFEGALLKDRTKAGSPELQYITAAVTSDDTSGLPKARAIGDAYMAQGTEMMKLSVPTELRLVHLRAANSIYRLGEITRDMSEIDEDPLLGMLGIIDYQPAAIEAIEALGAYTPILTSNQITFEKGEQGYSVSMRAQLVTEFIDKAAAQAQ